jgi:hypothetical protein
VPACVNSLDRALSFPRKIETKQNANTRFYCSTRSLTLRQINDPEYWTVLLLLVNSACFLVFPSPSPSKALAPVGSRGRMRGEQSDRSGCFPVLESHRRIGRLRSSISALFAQQPGTPEPPGTPPRTPDPTAPPPYEDPPRPIPIPRPDPPPDVIDDPPPRPNG